MEVDYRFFLPALTLLLLPGGLCYGPNVRYRQLDSSGTYLKSCLVGLHWHWLDLLRGALGAWLLLSALASDPTALGGTLRLARYYPLLVPAIILSVAITLQIFVCRKPGAALAPFMFATGLALATLPPIISLGALAIGWGMVLSTGHWAVFFFLVPVAAAIQGLLLSKSEMLELLRCAPAFLAAGFLPLLFPRDMVIADRDHEQERHE